MRPKDLPETVCDHGYEDCGANPLNNQGRKKKWTLVEDPYEEGAYLWDSSREETIYEPAVQLVLLKDYSGDEWWFCRQHAEKICSELFHVIDEGLDLVSV